MLKRGPEGCLADEHAPRVDAWTLAWSIPLAALVPWRAFPIQREARLAPLAIFYFLCLAGSLALSFFGWRTAAFSLSWQSVVVQQVGSYIWPFVGLYAVVTLSAASRQQRVHQTLLIGLKFALAGKVSFYLYGIAIFGIVRLSGMQMTERVALLVVGVDLYMTAAMSLAAAWLADREHAVYDPSDPLWPRCKRCEYSLHGLPVTEAWLARQSGGDSPPAMASEVSQECPECGLAVADSLQECERQLVRRKALEGARPEPVQLRTLLTGMVTLRPGRLAAWVINTRRTTAVALWLICAAVPTAALVWHGFQRGMPLPSYFSALVGSYFHWQQVLLWTGLVGLLVALRFSLRIRWNALYLGQHALVPAILAGGIILVVLRAAYSGVWPYLLVGLRSDQSLCLLLAAFVFVVELLLLRNVEGLMMLPGQGDRSSDRSAGTNRTQPCQAVTSR